MPAHDVYLQAEQPKGGITICRLAIGQALKGWITGITNKSLGPLWFPMFARGSYDIQNPADTLRIDSIYTAFGQPMGSAELKAVYGSPTPVFPLEILAIVDYGGGSVTSDVNPEMFPPPTGDSTMVDPPPSEGDPNWGDDVGSGSIPTLAYVQVGIEYSLPEPIVFSPSIRLGKHVPFSNDGCGHSFQLVGATLSVLANLSNVQADGVIISTEYRWHVSGAQVVSGVVDADTDNRPIGLLLDTPGTVQIDLSVTIVSQVTGGNVVTETGTRMSTIRFNVLTPQQAGAATVACKLQQESQQVRRLIFPGDPALARLTIAQQRQQMTRLGQRVSAQADALVASLDQLLHDAATE